MSLIAGCLKWFRKCFAKSDLHAIRHEKQVQPNCTTTRDGSLEALGMHLNATHLTTPARSVNQVRIQNSGPTSTHQAARSHEETENFALSMSVASETGSAALGYLAGGSLMGGLTGAASSTPEHSSAPDNAALIGIPEAADMPIRSESWSGVPCDTSVTAPSDSG